MILEKRYLNMIKKLTASSAQETQMPRSAMCADNSALLLCKHHAERTGLACLNSDL
jgi:hypothetical protein